MRQVLYGVIFFGVMGDIWGAFHLYGLLEQRRMEHESTSQPQTYSSTSSASLAHQNAPLRSSEND